MTNYLKEFELNIDSAKISYNEGEPLKLNNDYAFFHNKNKFRKELNKLQYLFKNYTGDSLVASGIRDTYLKEEISEDFLIVFFTTNDTVKNADEIIEPKINLAFETGDYYLKSSTNYILLMSKDMAGLIAGINTLESVFTQVFEHYLKINDPEDYVKIRPFEIYSN
ncbi:MAG: hypothetical protein KGD66_03205 [Candidatus Lokiarchaeota archaeon]|nr:hypothetical protein [Candidatus Lokiarchaeota archaeon]